ncbi:TIR-like protein FxsC [Nonomuraea sp. NPDC050536]|uniref:TIR-like protein FxsC n=1 Tax=Nonomuraea sp. NPDC050536 TaxID=3364366 RepID=UPI0037C6C83B
MTSRPYFFMSYAHTPGDQDDERDPDRWVFMLFNDLRVKVAQLADIRHLDEVGFMAGDETRLATAVATCRVFVPLYSPRYFASENCGKEWSAFARRGSLEAIVPALWTPVSPSETPEVTKDPRITAEALGEPYDTMGFYGIMKLNRFRSDYEKTVDHLARRVVEAAAHAQPAQGVPTDYFGAPNAFKGPARRAPLHITVASLTVDNVPAGRATDRYGERELDWNPYYPTSKGPIARYAAELARREEYQPVLRSFDEDVDELLSGGEHPAWPGILLVDPWTLAVPERRERLGEFDALHKPWIAVLMPWPSADDEPELRDVAERTLGRKLLEGRAAARSIDSGIPTVQQFGRTLLDVARVVGSRFLRVARTFPPQGPAVRRPRLLGPSEGREESR